MSSDTGDVGPMLERVRAALSNDADAADDLVDMMMVGFDLTFAGDHLVAAIAEDSALEEASAVRSTTSRSRFITCEGGDVRFELELIGGEVIGTIDPPRPGQVTMLQPGESGSSDVGDSGAFSLALPGRGPFRVLFVDTSGVAVSTVWILP